MRRREEPRGPRPPVPAHLQSFDAMDWGCFEDPPSPEYCAAAERWRLALRARCEEHGTNPLELLRERYAARVAANPDHYTHGRRNPA